MRILLGMSGGVDSVTSAKLLLDAGHDVEGCIVAMHEYTELGSATDAALELGIKLHVVDASESFNMIKENFVREYSQGRTPNPCILCNEKVKFRFLYNYAMANGFDRIATGHYAKIVKTSECGAERFALSVPADTKKDQTYMLYRLSEEILACLVFPLSDLKKDEVRHIAMEKGISAASKEDSQEICFIPDGAHAEYIENKLGSFPHGNFVDPEGNILGEHKGIIRYTVGQRKGLGIALGERAFVTNIDPLANTVTLSPRYEGRKEFCISSVVFSGMEEPHEQTVFDAFVRVRYTAPFQKAEIGISKDGSVRLRFDDPVKASTGQSAVVYSKSGTVLLGGIIE